MAKRYLVWCFEEECQALASLGVTVESDMCPSIARRVYRRLYGYNPTWSAFSTLLREIHHGGYMEKMLLVDRFDRICLRMEEEVGRDLTDEEEDEAILLLWRELYGEDNDPTPEELTDLWAELAEDFAEHTLGEINDYAHAAQSVEHHKKMFVH